MHRKKRIYLNEKKTNYCIVKLYKHKNDMQEAYKEARPQDRYYKCLGAHEAYEKLVKRDAWILSPETGTVYLCLEHCGAGIVTHELMHAVFWAYKHKRNKKQYPIVIKSMQQEEEVLRNFTYAVRQFYTWYWMIKKKFR